MNISVAYRPICTYVVIDVRWIYEHICSLYPTYMLIKHACSIYMFIYLVFYTHILHIYINIFVACEFIHTSYINMYANICLCK